MDHGTQARLSKAQERMHHCCVARLLEMMPWFQKTTFFAARSPLISKAMLRPSGVVKRRSWRTGAGCTMGLARNTAAKAAGMAMAKDHSQDLRILCSPACLWDR